MNKVFLHGRLGADPDLRFTQGGTAVLNLRLATTDRVKKGDEWTNETTWHQVVMFGKRAEALSKTLEKGSGVVVEGRIRNSSWEKDGVKRYKSEIIVDDLEFGAKKGSGSRADDGYYDERSGNSGGSRDANRSQARGQGSTSSGGGSTPKGDDSAPADDWPDPSDDIPF